MERFDSDTLVIGAGVVGLACARALAMAGRDVVIAEANAAIGQETTARNSEVVHAGIYYPTHSLKADTCVAGRRLLYDFCERRGVPFNKCGKLIVATETAQISDLDRLKAKGEENGVEGLTMLGGNAAIDRQPNLRAVAALLSPESGIVDSHAFILSLLGDAEDHGAMLAVNAPAVGGHVTPNGDDMRCVLNGRTWLSNVWLAE